MQEEDTRTIEEDRYYYYTFSLPESGTLSYEFIIRDGPAIDVLVMSDTEYDAFDDGDRFRRYTDACSFDSTGDRVTTGLAAGDYYLVFDNTDASEAYPPANGVNDVVRVEFTLDVMY